MRYFLLLSLLLIGCSKPPTHHKFTIGDCYIAGDRIFIIKDIGKFGYASITVFNAGPTFELLFIDENLVNGVDCKFAEENKHE